MWTINFQVDLQKAEESEIKLPTSVGSSKKHESSIKISTAALLTMPKPLWIITNCGGKGIPDTLPASWEICTQVKKRQLESDMEQQPDSKLGKEYREAVYCHLAYLTYTQNTSCEIWGKYQ